MSRPAIVIALPPDEAAPVADELRSAGFPTLIVADPVELETVLTTRRDVAVAILDGETDFDARYAIWEQIQEKIYTEIPAVKLGDASLASYYSERIGGWTQIIQRGVPYWNLWLNDA